ncbi:MAG: hypothetical protein E7655_02570 [Ruminococcaceae bacterium]|nr:hypothetical protein [Oscillospiraceae bacterium]
MSRVSKKSERYDMYTTVEESESSGGQSKIVSFLAKIIALLAAFGIWFYASSVDNTVSEAVFTVPVQIENAIKLESENGWSVISGANNYVEVKLSGPKNAVSKLTEEQVEAYADVGGITAVGRHQLDVTVVAPGEFTVKEKSVNSISVYVDRKMSLTVPVEVKLTDYILESNCWLGDPIPSLKEVAVTGPSSEVERIKAARVTLRLGAIRQSLTAGGTLVPVDENGNEVTGSYMSLKATEVTVNVNLYSEAELPLVVGNKYGFYNESNVKIDVTPSTVKVRGEPLMLASLNGVLLTDLNEKKMTDEENTVVVPIVMPVGLELVDDIESATVTVKQIGTVTATQLADTFIVKNPKRLKYTITNESLILTLRGPEAAFAKLTEDSITLHLDLSNVTGGNTTLLLPLEVKFSDDVSGELYELGEYKVQVKLQ